MPFTGVFMSLPYLDNQAGDLDMTRGDSDTGPAGITKKCQDVFVCQWVVSSPRRRQSLRPRYRPVHPYRARKRPGRYYRTHVPVKQRYRPVLQRHRTQYEWRYMVRGPNPVEACENCYSTANVQRTCMDRVRKVILVRSCIPGPALPQVGHEHRRR